MKTKTKAEIKINLYARELFCTKSFDTIKNNKTEMPVVESVVIVVMHINKK
jgi:hypothetical protein